MARPRKEPDYPGGRDRYPGTSAERLSELRRFMVKVQGTLKGADDLMASEANSRELLPTLHLASLQLEELTQWVTVFGMRSENLGQREAASYIDKSHTVPYFYWHRPLSEDDLPSENFRRDQQARQAERIAAASAVTPGEETT